MHTALIFKEYAKVNDICWILILEEYGVTFEYLPGKKKFGTVADSISHLDIGNLKIQLKKHQNFSQDQKKKHQ
jgi:hypothetical protein